MGSARVSFRVWGLEYGIDILKPGCFNCLEVSRFSLR